MATRSANLPIAPSGDGPSVAIADLVGQKTVVLSGQFQGSYTLFASHDGSNFAPTLLFNSDGQEQISLTLAEAYAFVRLRTNANTTGAVTASISAVSAPGQNTFAAFPTVPAGASGPQPSIDTFALVPPTGFEVDLNVICSPTLLTGAIIVEGSNNNVNFNPIGTFSGGQVQRALVGLPATLEFAPLPSQDVVRYFRLNIQGQLLSPTTFTIGGGVSANIPGPPGPPGPEGPMGPAGPVGSLGAGAHVTTVGGIIPSPPANSLLVTVDAGLVVNGMVSTGLVSYTIFWLTFTNACMVANGASVAAGQAPFYLYHVGATMDNIDWNGLNPLIGGSITVQYFGPELAGIIPFAPCFKLIAGPVA
jgi:hypothetical protein